MRNLPTRGSCNLLPVFMRASWVAVSPPIRESHGAEPHSFIRLLFFSDWCWFGDGCIGTRRTEHVIVGHPNNKVEAESATFTCSSMSLEVAQTTEASAPPKPSSLGEAAAASVAEASPVPFSMLRRLAGIQPSFLASSTSDFTLLLRNALTAPPFCELKTSHLA